MVYADFRRMAGDSPGWCSNSTVGTRESEDAAFRDCLGCAHQPLEELSVSRGYAWQLESTVGDFEAFPSFEF